MKIGILYYSRTGNTRKVAKTIEEKLKLEKAEVDLIEIEHEKKPGFFKAARLALAGKDIPIKNTNFNLKKYDFLITGTPTWGGRPSPYVKTYLKKSEDIKDKKGAIFITGAGDIDKNEKVFSSLKQDLDNLGMKTHDNHIILQFKKDQIINGEENIDVFLKNVMNK